MGTKIEWTDATWNCVTGCTKVSSGCRFCYAETIANRFWATQYPPVDGRPRRFTDVICHPDRLEIPLHWRKPRRVFVNSMSDLFHKDIPLEFIAAVFGVMAATPHHTYQILTKRPDRALEFCDEYHRASECLWTAELFVRQESGKHEPRLDGVSPPWPLRNVWLGVSVEDQATADARLAVLAKIPAAVRFASYEPGLAAVDFRFPAGANPVNAKRPENFEKWSKAQQDDWYEGTARATYMAQCDTLDWVIVGGESGAGTRPFDVQWARDTIAQCKAAGVPCFVKQLGARPIDPCECVRCCGPNEHPGGCRKCAGWGDRELEDHELADDITGSGYGPCPDCHGSGDCQVCGGANDPDNGGPRSDLELRDPKGGDPSEWPDGLNVREFPMVETAKES